MERADERLARNMTLYKQRQMIVEHPFGTIKRTMGYTHFLLRGIEKVRGEAVMHCLMYNLKRVLKILGMDKLMAAIRKFSVFTSKIAAVSFRIQLFRLITLENMTVFAQPDVPAVLEKKPNRLISAKKGTSLTSP
ncbi:hypothetical protein SDC9_191278 [bioreactor metagenome]|uniref:Transposase DDE domain-containing protein n=1 Tax=bioreactor metagenome TaxID=1076179 RepID=A0A645HXI8_9ZZZZ